MEPVLKYKNQYRDQSENENVTNNSYKSEGATPASSTRVPLNESIEVCRVVTKFPAAICFLKWLQVYAQNAADWDVA